MDNRIAVWKFLAALLIVSPAGCSSGNEAIDAGVDGGSPSPAIKRQDGGSNDCNWTGYQGCLGDDDPDVLTGPVCLGSDGPCCVHNGFWNLLSDGRNRPASCVPGNCGWQVCNPDADVKRCGPEKLSQLPICEYPCETDDDCNPQHRCVNEIGGFKFCNYTWEMAPGVAQVTELCPPLEAMYYAWCAMVNDEETVVCAPENGVCCLLTNVCSDGPSCAWTSNWEMSDCADINGSPVSPPPPGVDCSRYIGPCPLECTMDAHCPAGQHCTRRLGNMMFCE